MLDYVLNSYRIAQIASSLGFTNHKLDSIILLPQRTGRTASGADVGEEMPAAFAFGGTVDFDGAGGQTP
jgi:hypothetical protein